MYTIMYRLIPVDKPLCGFEFSDFSDVELLLEEVVGGGISLVNIANDKREQGEKINSGLRADIVSVIVLMFTNVLFDSNQSTYLI